MHVNYKKDDLITVLIEDMGTDGEGIGKIDGFTFFIKDAVIGDQVQAKIMKVKKGYAYAKLLHILVPSSDRTTPLCNVHRQCGGCQIQALTYTAQLAFKTRKVKNNLVRIGGFLLDQINQAMEPIVGMQSPYHYRNKAQFPVGIDKNGQFVTGFYAGRTHDIIANTDCLLGVKENQIILETILTYMRENGISPYIEQTGQGIIRHILLKKGFATGEIMVCIIINADTLPQADKLVKLLQKIDGIVSISININKQKTNVIMGEKVCLLWGNDTITDLLSMHNGKDIHVDKVPLIQDSIKKSNEEYLSYGDSICFAISPHSFYQVNPIQTEKLYSIAVDYAGLTGTETVWDLYCGIGTISLFMSRKAKHVYGVERVEQAVLDAQQNAARNNIHNATFYVGKAEEVLPDLYDREGIYADVICVDPPRKGCDDQCLATIIKMAPKRIVYVSCDSATLARDLKYLCTNGYHIDRLRPVDLFPHTVHVECVVLLSKEEITPKKMQTEHGAKL